MKTVCLRSALFLSTALLILPVGAGAQSVDPAHIQKRFEQQPTPRAVPAPIVQTPQDADQISAESEAIKFQLDGVKIEGATIYSDEALNAVFADLVGKEVTLADVQRAVNAITVKYRNDGYVLSKAVLPPQQISSGTVKVQVVEGYVASVAVEGEKSRTQLIQKYANKIQNGKPLNIKHLERYLLLANDLPGVSAKAVLRPAASVGGAEVVITVEEKRYEASLGVDNRGTKFLGPIQFTGIVSGNSLLGLYDRTTVRSIVTSNTEELRFFDFQHEEQLGTEGTRVRLVAARSDSEPGSTLAPLEIQGESTSFAAHVSHPVIRSRTQNLSVEGILDYRDTQSDLLGFLFSEDHISALRLGGEFDTADPWNGVDLLHLQLSQGLDILGATDEGAGRTRADGDQEFTKLELQASRRQELPWNLGLLTAFSGQYAFDPLLSAEEYTLGGIGFGQAYDPAELSGDHGAALHVELQYGNVLGWQYFDSYQAYTYYDIGAVWQEETSVTAYERDSLASAGIGLRFNATENLSGNVEVGFPLTRDVDAEGDKDPRFFFGLIGRF